MSGCLHESERSAAAIDVVASLVSGWQLMTSCCHQIGVEHEVDAVLRVVDRAEHGDRAGNDAETAPSASPACRRRPGWRRRSACGSSSDRRPHPPRPSTRKKLSFLSLRNRFLVWPPGISPRSATDSATVKSGGWSTVSCAMPSRRRKAKRSSRVFGHFGHRQSHGRRGHDSASDPSATPVWQSSADAEPRISAFCRQHEP